MRILFALLLLLVPASARALDWPTYFDWWQVQCKGSPSPENCVIAQKVGDGRHWVRADVVFDKNHLAMLKIEVSGDQRGRSATFEIDDSGDDVAPFTCYEKCLILLGPDTVARIQNATWLYIGFTGDPADKKVTWLPLHLWGLTAAIEYVGGNESPPAEPLPKPAEPIQTIEAHN